MLIRSVNRLSASAALRLRKIEHKMRMITESERQNVIINFFVFITSILDKKKAPVKELF